MSHTEWVSDEWMNTEFTDISILLSAKYWQKQTRFFHPTQKLIWKFLIYGGGSKELSPERFKVLQKSRKRLQYLYIVRSLRKLLAVVLQNNFDDEVWTWVKPGGIHHPFPSHNQVTASPSVLLLAVGMLQNPPLFSFVIPFSLLTTFPSSLILRKLSIPCFPMEARD